LEASICLENLPKISAGFFLILEWQNRSFDQRNPEKRAEKMMSVFRMSRFTSQNGAFCFSK